MKCSFRSIRRQVPDDDVAFLSSGEETSSVSAPRETVEFIAVRVDTMFEFKPEIAFSGQYCLGEGEGRMQRDAQDDKRESGMSHVYDGRRSFWSSFKPSISGGNSTSVSLFTPQVVNR